MEEDLEYKINEKLSVEEYRDLLIRSTLAERRPVEDYNCLMGMLDNSNLIITVRDNQKLVGISRSITDFNYACYLSDLAVDSEYQRLGIGKYLIHLTQQQLKAKCKIILISAPKANEYYPSIGFTHNPRAWILERDKKII